MLSFNMQWVRGSLSRNVPDSAHNSSQAFKARKFCRHPNRCPREHLVLLRFRQELPRKTFTHGLNKALGAPRNTPLKTFAPLKAVRQGGLGEFVVSQQDQHHHFTDLWKQSKIKPGEPQLLLAEVDGVRGLFADRDITAGTPLIQVPWELSISVDDSHGEFGWDAELACRLLEKMEDAASPWASYAAFLPTNFSSVTAWTDEQIAELQVDEAIQAVHELRDHLQYQAKLASSLHPALAADRIAWALLMVHSRSFWLEVPPVYMEQVRPRPQSTKLRVLVPFADQFNHAFKPSDSTCDTPWELQSSVDGLHFQVVADRNFQKGEQLTFDYGHSKNIELLVSYGFLIPENAADTVALYESGEDLVDDDRWTPSSNLKVLRRKEMMVYEAITRSTAKPEDLLGVRADGSGQAPELCEFLRILHADSSELDMLAGSLNSSAHFVLSQKTEQSVAQHIAWRCAELLADFPTTLEEDVDLQAELGELAGARGASEDLSIEQAHKQLALSFRISVKRALLGGYSKHNRIANSFQDGK